VAVQVILVAAELAVFVLLFLLQVAAAALSLQ
jgi:hypothetical protein